MSDLPRLLERKSYLLRELAQLVRPGVTYPQLQDIYELVIGLRRAQKDIYEASPDLVEWTSPLMNAYELIADILTQECGYVL